MKKHIIIFAVLILFTATTIVVAKDNSSIGQPFQAIWDAIVSLQERGDNNEDSIVGLETKAQNNENNITELEARIQEIENHLNSSNGGCEYPAECNASTICGESCNYGGQTYNTVLIGTQCWFKENLNVGIMLGNLETPDNVAPVLNDPNTVSKWCFNDSSTYCDNEGGLYTWPEANALPHSCKGSPPCDVPTTNQGICPVGWHIPSDSEFFTLENYLTTPGETCDAERAGYDCSNAGTKLRFGGSSGFDAISAGNHETNGESSYFDKREPSIHFWSSSPNPSHAYNRKLIAVASSYTVRRSMSWKVHGFSVRCLADTANTE